MPLRSATSPMVSNSCMSDPPFTDGSLGTINPSEEIFDNFLT